MCKKTVFQIGLLLLVGLASVLPTSAQESCNYSPGVQGVCKDIRQCPRVLRDIRNHARRPVICEVTGRYPSVCCPGDGPSTELDISEPAGFEGCGRSSPITTPDNGDVVASRSASLNNNRFVIGGEISQLAEWPWMALLGNQEASGDINWFCAGILINNQWVLTAAHCIDEGTVTVVRLGEYNYENDNDGSPHQDFSIEAPIRYPDYTKPQAYHDLALLKLTQRVIFQRFIRPACLAWGRESDRNMEGLQVTVTGWGDTLPGGRRSPVLQKVFVTVFPSAHCDRSYQNITNYRTTWPNGIGPESICSGDREGGKDACQGDSGGPMVSRDSKGRYTIAGVVSVGQGCGSVYYPGLYVNMRRPEYLAWIKKVAFSR